MRFRGLLHRVAPDGQHNGAMAPAVAIGGLVVLSLFALALTLRARPRPGSRVELRTIWAVPFVSAAVLVVGLVLLLLIPGVTPLVVVGLMAYTGVAAAAIWRMARLDSGSRWMEPSHRRAESRSRRWRSPGSGSSSACCSGSRPPSRTGCTEAR